jgi:hypothetical protein
MFITYLLAFFTGSERLFKAAAPGNPMLLPLLLFNKFIVG